MTEADDLDQRAARLRARRAALEAELAAVRQAQKDLVPKFWDSGERNMRRLARRAGVSPPTVYAALQDKGVVARRPT